MVLYANGFGPTSAPVVNGSETQSGTLRRLPVITIGGIAGNGALCRTDFARRVSVQRVIPSNAPSGDNPIMATYDGPKPSPAGLITVRGSAPPPTSVTLFVAPIGQRFLERHASAPNSGSTDGPFATFDHARAIVQSLSKTGLSQVNVQFRAGTYYLAVNRNVHGGRLRLGHAANRVSKLSRRIAGHQRRRARAELDQYERQHLEDHAARLHTVFRESVLQRSTAAAAAAGRLFGHLLPDTSARSI